MAHLSSKKVSIELRGNASYHANNLISQSIEIKVPLIIVKLN